MENDIVVSIVCATYNHSSYIRQCLDGFVMQRTNFKFEIIIHDDASTDDTQAIILEYVNAYPHLFRPILQKENQFSKHVVIGTTFIYPICRGKYIAFCEGDDYWTDPDKLQKQVDFLEANPNYSFCCHRFGIYDQNHDKYKKEYAYSFYKEGLNLEITEELFLKVWVTQILTTMVKTDLLVQTMKVTSQLYNSSRDVYLFYELLQTNKGISLNQNMGIYRWHDEGIAIGQDNISRYNNAITVYTKIYEKHPNDHLLINKILFNYEHLLRHLNWSKSNYSIVRTAMTYCKTLSQKIRLLANYSMPTCLYRFIEKLYITLHQS